MALALSIGFGLTRKNRSSFLDGLRMPRISFVYAYIALALTEIVGCHSGNLRPGPLDGHAVLATSEADMGGLPAHGLCRRMEPFGWPDTVVVDYRSRERSGDGIQPYYVSATDNTGRCEYSLALRASPGARLHRRQFQPLHITQRIWFSDHDEPEVRRVVFSHANNSTGAVEVDRIESLQTVSNTPDAYGWFELARSVPALEFDLFGCTRRDDGLSVTIWSSSESECPTDWAPSQRADSSVMTYIFDIAGQIEHSWQYVRISHNDGDEEYSVVSVSPATDEGGVPQMVLVANASQATVYLQAGGEQDVFAHVRVSDRTAEFSVIHPVSDRRELDSDSIEYDRLSCESGRVANCSLEPNDSADVNYSYGLARRPNRLRRIIERYFVIGMSKGGVAPEH